MEPQTSNTRSPMQYPITSTYRIGSDHFNASKFWHEQHHPCRFLDRTKVTANVVDIEADAQTVLHAAAVQDIGGGMYQVWLAFTNESWTLSIGPIRDGGNLRDLALL